jgi:predicted nuclease of predicted toxin-antitoxin system
MILVADEGVEGRIVAMLRTNGYSVTYIAESFPRMEDPDILALAVSSNSVLVTKDKDFGELVFKEKLPHSGIVLIRLPEEMPSQRKAELVLNAFQTHGQEFSGSFSVIDERFVRIRPQRT